MFEPNLEADLILMGNDASRSRIPACSSSVMVTNVRTRRMRHKKKQETTLGGEQRREKV